tara:strand:+ start:573 stop:1106 length:534 start_codon:yes stop_codon:yes gene_type:complete
VKKLDLSFFDYISCDRYLSILLIALIMTKIREPLSTEHVLSNIIKKLDENDIKNITDKSVSHFRKCSDLDDKDHTLYLIDAIKLDILMQRKSLGTPLLDNFQLMLEQEFKKINSFENLENTLLNIGGRVGNLMDVVQEAINPESSLGKELSKKEKDLISKSIIDLEEKIANLKLSIK